MYRAIRKNLSVVFCGLLLLCTAAVGVTSGVQARAADGDASASGLCGETVNWYYYAKTGLLSIEGTGDMQKYENMSAIPWYPFRYAIQTVRISDGVTNIARAAFSDCSILEEVTIPDSVKQIESSAFHNCMALKSITIPDGVTRIENSTFNTCRSLARVTLPDNLTCIGAYAFARCSALTDVTIPESVECIENDAFLSCSALTNFAIPSGVTTIGRLAFDGCTGLVQFSVDENNTAYSSDAAGVLYSKNRKTLIRYPAANPCASFTVPNGVTRIEEKSFSDSGLLTEVIVPKSVNRIGKNAFSGCSSLADIMLTGSVPEILSETFSRCTALVRVTIPEGVVGIAEKAFSGCTSLVSLTIPKSLLFINHGIVEGCTSFTDVYYAGSETDRQKIGIASGSGNDILRNAVWHYDYHIHAWGNNAVFVEPTCTEAGSRTYTCTTCGETMTQDLPALGHMYRATVTQPTCTDGGFTICTCERCGDTYTDDRTAPLGHAYQWTSNHDRTFFKDGTETGVCLRCGDSMTRTAENTSVAHLISAFFEGLGVSVKDLFDWIGRMFCAR